MTRFFMSGRRMCAAFKMEAHSSTGERLTQDKEINRLFGQDLDRFGHLTGGPHLKAGSLQNQSAGFKQERIVTKN